MVGRILDLLFFSETLDVFYNMKVVNWRKHTTEGIMAIKLHKANCPTTTVFHTGCPAIHSLVVNASIAQ